MARRYSKEEVKDLLWRATYRLVAEEGIEKVTMRKVANGCGLSTPYIYQCYRDMQELLQDAYLNIDMEISNLVHIVGKSHAFNVNLNRRFEDATWMLWSMYWEFLMSDADKTIFCWRFYNSGYYNAEILDFRKLYYQDLVDYVKQTGVSQGAPFDVKLNAILSNIIDNTMSAAAKIHLGYAEKDALTPRLLYESEYALLFHLFGLNVWENPNRPEQSYPNSQEHTNENSEA